MLRMTSFDFALVDVFADAPLAGNPLAVVFGGEELDDEVMASVAREFNQSETTFVLPPRRPGALRRLRSFTSSGAEVTGAGHNALGAWWVLASRNDVEGSEFGQELGDEVLPVEVTREGGRVTIQMTQSDPQLGVELSDVTALARALRLDPAAIGPQLPQVVSTGAPHMLVEVVDRAAVDRAAPDAPGLARVLADANAQGCYLFAVDNYVTDVAAYARFFNPSVGLWEDPATGSAAGPLAWWLTMQGRHPGDRVGIEQGHALGRPSRIEVSVAGVVVKLAGSAALAAEGTLHLARQRQEETPWALR